MAKAILNNFARTEIILQPQDNLPDIDIKIGQSLSRLLGWDEDNERWLMLRVDDDGRLLISTSPSQTDVGNNSAAAPTTTSSVILVSNANRKSFIIANTGGTDCYIMYAATALTASGMLLKAGQILSENQYTGVISAITASGVAGLRIIEL